MADKKSWRDYYKRTADPSDKTKEETESWRDYYNQPGSENASGGSAESWRNYYNVGAVVSNRIADDMNRWLKSYNMYAALYQNRYSDRKYSYEDAYVSDSTNWMDAARSWTAKSNDEANQILAYVNTHESNLDPDWVKEVRETIANVKQSQRQMLVVATQDNSWWSAFGSDQALVDKFGSPEEVYNYFVRSDGYKKKYTGLSFDEIIASLDALGDGEEKEWLSGNISSVLYDTLSQKDDFEANSAFKTKYLRPAEKYTPPGDYHEYIIDDGYSDIWYDYINRQKEAIDLQAHQDVNSYAYLAGLDKGYLLEMTDDEIKVYNYLYQTQSKEAADKYIEVILSDLNYRLRESYQESAAAYAKEHPFLASAESVLMSPLKTISAIGQIGAYMKDGKIDENAGYNKYSYMQTAIRGTVSAEIAKPENGVWGEIGSWTYGLGMSAGDFVINTAVSGGNPIISSALMGSGAMADTVIEAKDRGLSDDQAFSLGAIAAVAEIVTEKVSLDMLLKGDMTKGALKYIISNAITGGSEEVASSLINLAADIFISKDKSKWAQEINEYRKANPEASEAEAFQSVFLDTAASLGLDFLAGALMEGSFGAVGAGIHYVTTARPGLQENVEAVSQYGDSVPALIEEGMGNDPKSRSYDLAQYYGRKVKNGETLSGYEIRNLVEANDTARINNAVRSRLSELGETGNISKIAEAITKQATGEELSFLEERLIQKSKYGQRVVEEMNPGNIFSGKHSSAWAEDIGTRSINAVAYNSKAIHSILDAAKPNAPVTYKSVEERIGNEGQFNVSEDGQAKVRATGAVIDFAEAEVSQVGNGEITFKLKDGTEVYAGDIDFANDSQSYLVSAISYIENITPGAATAMIRDIVDYAKPIGEQINGIDEAFTYGYHGYTEADLKAGAFTGKLTGKQLMSAYKLGQAARKAEVDTPSPRVQMRTADKHGKKSKPKRKSAGTDSGDVNVYFQDGKNVRKFEESGKYDDKRMAAVHYARLLSELGIGNDYYFYESYVNKERVRVFKNSEGEEVAAPNGWYDMDSGNIYIDLNAGENGEGTALFTLGHELTHFIKAWSDKKFKVLADFLIAEYGKTKMSMRERVIEKQSWMQEIQDKKGSSKQVSYNEAFEEVVADAMSTMLSDGNLHEKLAQLKSKDGDLFDRIKKFFADLIEKFREIYKKLTPEQRDARDVRAMKDAFNNIQQAFAEALVDASNNFRTSSESFTETDTGTSENAETEQQTAPESKPQNEPKTRTEEDSDELDDLLSEYFPDDEDGNSVSSENQGDSTTDDDSEWEDVDWDDDDDTRPAPKPEVAQPENPETQTETDTATPADEEKVPVSKEMSDLLEKRRILKNRYEVYLDANNISAFKKVFDELMAVEEKIAELKAGPGGPKFSYRGKNGDGIEVYETSDETKKLPYTERQKQFLGLMENKYRGRTAKFMRNGHAYYATFEKGDINKNIYGDKLSDKKGWRAKINVGAEGNIFELVENAQYDGSRPEKGKKIASHRGVGYWDYFIKNVQIDGTVFDLIANVRKKTDGSFVYSIQLNENKKIKASPPLGSLLRASNGVLNASADSLPQPRSEVKKNSDRGSALTAKINESLTMQEARQMIQRAFVIGNIKEWYDGEYQNGDEWLAAQGAEEVAMYIENEYTLQAAYLDKIPGLLDEEFFLTDVLEAYQQGTLTGKVKKKTERINIADGVIVADPRFYAPKEVEAAKELYEIASRRITKENREEVNRARAQILLYAHNKGAAETLGITQSELNKKLRSWGGYSAKARDISMRINAGVHTTNRWTGIESLSWLNKATVMSEDVLRMVKAVEGNGDRFQNNYIARTMLALDTHIDWSWLTIKFDTYAGVNKSSYFGSKCNGYYRNDGRLIHVKYDAPNTVAHEMGHALDYQWGRDIGYSSTPITEISRNTEKLSGEVLTWFNSFKDFTDSLVASSDLRSEYAMDIKETFARFVAKFVEWTEQLATGRTSSYETSYYQDKFTATQFIQFARLLQEKSAIDARGLTQNKLDANGEAVDTLANETVAAQPKDAGVKNSDRSNGFNEHDVVSAVYTIRYEKAQRGHDLVKIGSMPTLYRDLFDLNGDVYVSNEHLYRNMVSKATAEAEGRFKADASADYHELGEPKIINAIEQFQDPLVIMESLKDYNEPRLVAVLDEKGNDGQNLIAVLELYSAQPAYGVPRDRNHVLITIYEKNSLPDYIGKTMNKGRIMHIKNGVSSDTLASLQLAGNISEETLRKNVARFNKKVKDFKAKNKIFYSERTGDAVSNRTLLANAFEGLSRNSDEYAMIQRYRNRIRLLEEQEEKLAKINAEIREIRFTKGKYDAGKLAELEAKAQEISKAITRHDKKLLEMEVSAPFRKVIEQERRKEAQKTRAHVAEVQQNKKLRAEQAEIRHKLRKVIRDLNKILNGGNKQRNVKEDMRGFVSKALELADYLFTDHISNDELIRRGIDEDLMRGNEVQLVKETEEILTQLYDNIGSLTNEEYTRLDAKRKANMEKLRELLAKQRNRRLNIPVYNLFNDLVTEYSKLKDSNQDAVKAAYNPEVERFLRSYMGDKEDGTDSDRKTLLQNMRVADMTTQELEHLYYAYTMVLHSVRTANKLFVQGKAESIEKMVEQISADFGKRKIPEKKLAIIARNIANKIGWDYEKLYYALDRIGSEAFTELVMNVANSENIVMQDVIEAAIFRDEMVEKYGFNNWKVDKKIDREFVDNTGKKFKLTLGQLMALYAYSRRKGAWDHIEYGGFVFGDEELTNPNPADSYKLTREQCEAITDLLTAEQKGYVEAMQKFLSETMGGKGNEVSMMLYGIKMFTEKIYFPIKVAGQFKPQAQEAQAKAAAGFSSMTNAGFTHEQNPNAKAPFVLEGFNEVWADHVNEMSRYHGAVPALEDMRRVMNRSAYADSAGDSVAIKQLMENAFGKEAVQYFDNLYREANSGAITDNLQAKSHRLLSLFRKNSVAYSLSVLIQQPAAMVRAYALIDRKYFGLHRIPVLPNFALTSGIFKAAVSKWNKAYGNAYSEMLKYAPGVTMAKEIGGFDTHTGSSIRGYLLDTKKSFGQKVKTDKHGKVIGGIKAAYEFVDDNAFANLPNVADKIAWIEIWNACKRETISKHKDLVPTSDEFLQIVGDRFTEVIRATQVYDSMFSKSPMLKSKNFYVQMLVSFMNEPNTVANMVEKAVRDVKKGNWKGGLKTAVVVVHSIVFTNLLKSIIYAMRDDDEDETYIEKYIEALTGGLLNDFVPFNYIPIVRDAWSLAQGYDVERADMAIIADAIDALYGVFKNAFTDTDGMTEEQLEEFDKKVIEANWKLAESVAAFFGIPLKNVRREVKGFIDHARIASKNAGMTTWSSALDKALDGVVDSIPFMQSNRTKRDKLYEAMITGDEAYLSRIRSTYKTEADYVSAVRKALQENDPRVHDAAMARYEGRMDDYQRICREIQSEGIFNLSDIIKAVVSEENKIRKGVEPEKATSTHSTTDYVEALVLGDRNSATAIRNEIIDTMVVNGKTQKEAEKEFTSDIATGIRDAYSSGLLDEARAKRMLQDYANKDEDKAASMVSYWAFCEDHPEYKDILSESNVADYHEFAEPADISLDVFVRYIEGTKGLETKYDEWGDVEESKREQVLEVIDSLPLTWQQKDALYLAHRYAESKIWDVPW